MNSRVMGHRMEHKMTPGWFAEIWAVSELNGSCFEPAH